MAHREKPHPANMAVDGEGRSLALSPEEVRKTVERMLDDGDIIAVLVRTPNGDLAFQVFGEPCQELLDALEQLAAAYRTVLKGQ